MCKKPPERRKVGDTLTATVSPLDTEIKEYQWYADGEAIEGATDDELLVTADFIGAEISVAVKATSGDFVFSDETAAVVALEGAQIINAEQSGTKTIRVEFSEAISVDDTLEVFKGTAKVEIEDIDYDGDFEGATLTMKDKITAAEYTVVLTPDEVGVDPSEYSFEGEVSALGTIEFLNNYLILADNTYQKGYAYVKGYDQFGTEINLAGLTVTCGVGDMTAYDSKTGKLTLESDTANAYMFIKQVPVFVSYQTGDGIISAQANLEVSTRSFVDEVEFGEIKKDGTGRADGRVTITELASKKYYVELTTVKDQYENDLSYKDLNKMVTDNVLFVIPGENNGAYYTTNGFDEIDGTTVLWLAPADDPKPGAMDLSITGAGGYTASTPVEIEDDPYIQTISITYPQLYSGHSKSADLAFSAVDQYGEEVNMWDVRPTLTDVKTLTFSDKNHMTGKATEVKLSGDITYNAVVEDTIAKTWTVNIDATAAQAKSMAVVTTLTAGMTPYTQTITIGAQGQAINVLNKLSSGSLELNPKSNDKVNFNKGLQFEDVNGEVMNRIDSEKYPIFSSDATIVLHETDSNVKISDYAKFYWYLSDTELPATSAYTLAGVAQTAGAANRATNPRLDADGEITKADLATAKTASKKYYVTVVGLAKGNYYKLSEQDFRVTYIPATDVTDGTLGNVWRATDNTAGWNNFDPTATTNKYSAAVNKPAIPVYVNSDNGTVKDIELTVTNDTGEKYTVPVGDGYRVSTDSGLKIVNDYQVSGKVSGPTSGTATLDVWLVDNDKKIDTITVTYSDAAPAPTSVKYEGVQSVANSNVVSKVGKTYTFTPATRVETSVKNAATVTAKDGKIEITHANNVEDIYTAQVKDQYEGDWTKAEFYVNGEKIETNGMTLYAGKEYVFKMIAGTVTKEITVVPGKNSTAIVNQVVDNDKSVSVASQAALVAAAAEANLNGTTTVTLTKDIELDGKTLVVKRGVKVVVPSGVELSTKAAADTITVEAGGELEISAGGLLTSIAPVEVKGSGNGTKDAKPADGYLTVNGDWNQTANITNSGVIEGSGHVEFTGVLNNTGYVKVTGLTLVLNTGSEYKGTGTIGGNLKLDKAVTTTNPLKLLDGTSIDLSSDTNVATLSLLAGATADLKNTNGVFTLTAIGDDASLSQAAGGALTITTTAADDASVTVTKANTAGVAVIPKSTTNTAEAASTAAEAEAKKEAAELEYTKLTIEKVADYKQAASVDESATKTALESKLAVMYDGWTAAVTIAAGGFKAPVDGTSSNANGTDGSVKYTYTLSKDGWTSEASNEFTTTLTAVAYVAPTTYSISGTVSPGSTGATVDGIEITLDDGDSSTTDEKVTVASGSYSFTGVKAGTYTLKIAAGSGYDSVNASVTVSTENVTKDIELAKGV